MIHHQALIIFLFLITGALFFFFPEIDLSVSSAFYSETAGFYWRDNFWIYLGSKLPTYLITATVFFVLGWFYRRYQKLRGFSLHGFRDILYLACALIFSAIILVWTFKLGFARVRPRFIQEFGGSGIFTHAFEPNLKPTQEGLKDVSFISGHASNGFMYMAAAFLYQGRAKHLLMLGSLALGSLIGFTRIASGNHYLSDVVIAAFMMYLGSLAIYNLFQAKTGLGR